MADTALAKLPMGFTDSLVGIKEQPAA